MGKTRWKRILPYALKHGVTARGYGPREIARQIVRKARLGKTDLPDEEWEEIAEIVMGAPEENGDQHNPLEILGLE